MNLVIQHPINKKKIHTKRQHTVNISQTTEGALFVFSLSLKVSYSKIPKGIVGMSFLVLGYVKLKKNFEKKSLLQVCIRMTVWRYV